MQARKDEEEEEEREGRWLWWWGAEKKIPFDSELVEKSKFTPVAVQFGPVDIKSRSRWLIRAMPAWPRGFKVFSFFFCR